MILTLWLTHTHLCIRSVLLEEYDKELGGVKRIFGPYGPESFEKAIELGYEKVKKYFNYGVLEVKENGDLTVEVKNLYGKVVFSKSVSPSM